MTGWGAPPLQSAHVCKTWRQQLVHLPYIPNSPGVTGRANLPRCHHCYLWYERSIRIKLVTSDAPWLSLVKAPQEAGSPGPGSSPRPLKESPPLHSSVYQDGVLVGRMSRSLEEVMKKGLEQLVPQRIQSCRNWSLIVWNWCSRLENDFKRLGLWKKPKLCASRQDTVQKKAHKTTCEVFSPKKLKMNLIKSLGFM